MPHTAPDSFISFLKTYSGKDPFRMLGSDILLEENKLEQTLSSYENWLKEATSSSNSKEALKKKLFNTEHPELFYVPLGNQCLSGYLLKLSTDEDLPGVERIQSAAISATNYLHPSDTAVKGLDGVELYQHPSKGQMLRFSTESKKILMTEPTAREIISALRNMAWLREKHPEINSSLRSALPVLKTIVLKAKAVGSKDLCIIPCQFINDIETTLLQNKGLSFLLKGEEVLFWYGHKGRHLLDFIDAELERAPSKKGFVGQLKLQRKKSSQPSKILGTVKVGGKIFNVEKKAFKDLIEQGGRIRAMRSVVGGRYTVIELIEQMSDYLANAIWVDSSSDSAPDGRPKRKLKFVPWTFLTGKNYTVYGITDNDRTR